MQIPIKKKAQHYHTHKNTYANKQKTFSLSSQLLNACFKFGTA